MALLHSNVTGKGPVLVLLHGFLCSSLIWEKIIPLFKKENKLILIDLPGHGKSSKTPGRYPPRRLAAAVLDVLDATRIQQAWIMGNSLGGATAIQLALDAPERIKGLILIGAPGGTPIPPPLQHSLRNIARPRQVETVSDEAIAFGWFVISRGLDPLSTTMMRDMIGLKDSQE